MRCTYLDGWRENLERNEDRRFVRAYLLSQSHQQLGEEELQANTNTEMIGVINILLHTHTQSDEMFTHHLTQPPQQEAHTDVWGAREVELVAQSRRKDKIIHV